MSSAKAKAPRLAILGAKPAFSEKLHVGRPNIGDRASFMRRMNDIFDRRWLTNDGPLVNELEKKIARFIGAKHCVAMCNGTVALEIAIRALEFKGEVIVPSFTFVATAHSLFWQGITPIFCDIDSRTHTLDPDKIEPLITPNTTGIIGVHTWGNPCDIEEMTRIAKKRKLGLLFDAAHAFGCSYRGKLIGNFGDAEVFSFHATKVFNTFEGGAVLTNDSDMAQKIRWMRNFGFAGYDKVIYIGSNGKMSEASAAMGLSNLESIKSFLSINERNFKLYESHLRGIPAITLLQPNPRERHNFHYVVVEIDAAAAGLSRDELVAVLWAENVLARRYFYPGCHRMEPYNSYFPYTRPLLGQTESVCGRTFQLPTGSAVSADDVRTICEIIRAAVQEAPRVARSLPKNGDQLNVWRK